MKKALLAIVLGMMVQSTATAACRSVKVAHQFNVMNGYPKGRPGYIIDHQCSLYNGGLDIVTNMQYQTLADSKLKDKWENTAKGRALLCNSKNSLPYRTVYNCKVSKAMKP